jgi:trehalose-6-phosphate synthase
METESGRGYSPDTMAEWGDKGLGLSAGPGGDHGRICVIANREPYIHVRNEGRIDLMTPASGLVTALEPIARTSGGLWIAHGGGSADRETSNERGVLSVPPNDPKYELKRVWLTPDEEQGYYYGFANEGLWPLFHIVHTRPIFRALDWSYYLQANEKFAAAFNEEVGEQRPVVLIQDYHFAPLPRMIRRYRPDAAISLFWHIPWSSPDTTRICPWKNELIEGMLSADLLGFQTQYHCNNFLECVDRFVEARIDRESISVTRQGHTCYIRPLPISIEWPTRYEVPPETIPDIRRDLLSELELPPDIRLGVGVDRIDYTKGIVERFLAIETMLDNHPDMAGNFTLIQIGAPSRSRIPRYQQLTEEVMQVANRINAKFAGARCKPITLRLTHHGPEQVFRFYRAADVCVVNSLHDGMNLVAKEYVASRSDGGGALVLSSFTGAARELTDAFVVNPYDIEGTAEAIFGALHSPATVLHERMARMRAIVSSHSVFEWGRELLEQTIRYSGQRAIPGEVTAAYGTA